MLTLQEAIISNHPLDVIFNSFKFPKPSGRSISVMQTVEEFAVHNPTKPPKIMNYLIDLKLLSQWQDLNLGHFASQSNALTTSPIFSIG